MFRRSEKDELNDIETSGQGSLLGSESVKVISPHESGYGSQQANPAGNISGNSGGSPQHSSAYSSAPVRNQEAAPRPQSSPSTSAYRHTQPQEQAPRPRMGQETKPTNFTGTSIGNSADRARETRRILTVGSDILLKGEIATCDRLIIEGKVDAVLNDIGTIELAESGSFKGVAQVENAEISGLFEGELLVKGRLVIYASGRVRGKVSYGEIEIERGGELTGEIKTISGSENARPGRATSDKASKEDKVAVA